MPYRDDQATLEARREELRRDLAEADRKVVALADAASDKEKLTRELASVEARLERVGARLPLLDNIRVASPCTASWDEMSGDEQVRFCGSCQKNVYNLSAMARDEAERLLARHEASICVRLYRRADGTVLTADCPVGVRRKRVRRTIVAAAGAGVMAAAAAAASLTVVTQGKPVRVTQGEMEVYPTIHTSEPPVMGSVAVEPTVAPKAKAPPPARAPAPAKGKKSPQPKPGASDNDAELGRP